MIIRKNQTPPIFSSFRQRPPALFRIALVLTLILFAGLACNFGRAPSEAMPASIEPEMGTTAAKTPPTATLPAPSATSTPTPTATPIIVAAVPGYVILTDIDEDDPYYAAVEKLRIYRAAEVVRFGEDVDEAKAALRDIAPDHMAVVIRPERMEEGFAFEVFQLAKDLKGGFDTDVAYGFITGATAEETVAYIEKVIAYEQNDERFAPAARTLWRTGAGSISNGASGPANKVTQDSVDLMAQLGFQAERIDLDPLTKGEILAEAGDAGLLFLYLHGSPDHIECGLTCQDIITAEDTAEMRNARLILSSSCYAATIQTWYPQHIEAPETYEDRAEQIDPAESFALGFLRNSALAYVGHMGMWGPNSWPLVLLKALVDDPDTTLGEMMTVWYDTPKGPDIVTGPAAPDTIGMDNNRFYFASMVLYGDPVLRLHLPSPSD